VVIRAVASDLEIVGTTRNEVAVTGHLPKGYRLDLSSSKGRTEVRVRPPKHSSGSGKLRIEVPRGSSINLKSVSSDVSVKAVEGETTVETVSGGILSDGKSSEVQAVSVSGKVEIQGGKKRTSARTVSGPIEVHGPGGRLGASSVSGDVKVENANVSRAELGTVSGNIRFDGTLAPSGPHEIKTHAGRIELHLPKNAPVDIHASTHAGSIRSELGNVKTRGKTQITVGKGGPTVSVRTFAGSIVIEAR
jgi:DUF4097 and DUF4098 domain-containing protein YvlB